MPEPVSDAAAEADLVLLDDDPSDLFAPTAQDSLPWRILIVDDDVDVHVVTKFALSNSSFLGRRLSFLHAYSGSEAMAMLRDTPDIALVLLDVIMEAPDAGLRVARAIRDELHNDLVRIVLRTGQPGQALEHSIIVDYDINDFWCKADLTTRKLFTTVIASLRAYASLCAAAHERDVLSAALARARKMQAVVEHNALTVTLDPHGRILDANAMLCQFAGQPRDALLGRDLHAIHPGAFPEPLCSELLAILQRSGNWHGDLSLPAPDGSTRTLRTAVMSFKDATGAPSQYVAVATVLDGA
jgi:PAS domain S-box-containing protein